METDIDYIEKCILEFKEVVSKDKEVIFKMMEDKISTYIRRKE